MSADRPLRYVLRVDGSVEPLDGPRTLREIYALIGCDTIDSVNLRDKHGRVMLVDDTGFIDRKPVNPEATKLYHSVCRPGTTHPICGDVAVVPDEDFA